MHDLWPPFFRQKNIEVFVMVHPCFVQCQFCTHLHYAHRAIQGFRSQIIFKYL